MHICMTFPTQSEAGIVSNFGNMQELCTCRGVIHVSWCVSPSVSSCVPASYILYNIVYVHGQLVQEV